MFTRIEKMTDCEYELVDKDSAPCSNPPVFIDRKGGHVVCVAHADSLETLLRARADAAEKPEPKPKAQPEGRSMKVEPRPGSVAPGVSK